MAIQTVQELIDMLMKVQDKSIQPFILCSADNELISIAEAVEEKELVTSGKPRVVILEAN